MTVTLIIAMTHGQGESALACRIVQNIFRKAGLSDSEGISRAESF